MSRQTGDVVLTFGALAPTIAAQVAAQGLAGKVSELEHFQADAEAITRLRVRGLISGTEVNRSYERLAKRVGRAVQTAAPPEVAAKPSPQSPPGRPNV